MFKTTKRLAVQAINNLIDALHDWANYIETDTEPPYHVCDNCSAKGPLIRSNERILLWICDKCYDGEKNKYYLYDYGDSDRNGPDVSGQNADTAKTGFVKYGVKPQPSLTGEVNDKQTPAVAPLGTKTREDAYFHQKDQDLIKARNEKELPAHEIEIQKKVILTKCIVCDTVWDMKDGFSICPLCDGQVKI